VSACAEATWSSPSTLTTEFQMISIIFVHALLPSIVFFPDGRVSFTLSYAAGHPKASLTVRRHKIKWQL